VTVAGDAVAALSLRKSPVGGPVNDRVPQGDLDRVRALLDAGTARGLVLLVHGYNNSLTEASASYDGFFALQRELAQLPAERALADNRVFVRTYWPGDADWGAASFLAYMKAVKNGVVAGERFAAAIRELARRPEPLDVHIVGHSMGCRVALEILRWLAGVPNVRVSRVVLMAAAVPTFRMEAASAGPDSLRSAYDATVGRGGLCRTLYSSSDLVLALAFPAGQTLAEGDEGLAPTAIGHEQWAAAVPPAGLTQSEVRKAMHSDYWGGETSKRGVAIEAQKLVREVLGFQSSAAREVAPRDAGAREAPAARELAAARATAARASPGGTG
jgi:pimeloyl-ACP methyl ester carboxylesterase